MDGGNGTRRGAADVSRQSAPSQPRGALLAKELERKTEGETITKALTLIAPSDTLAPGTEEYGTIKDMILGCNDECDRNYALEMDRKGTQHLDSWMTCR